MFPTSQINPIKVHMPHISKDDNIFKNSSGFEKIKGTGTSNGWLLYSYEASIEEVANEKVNFST